MWVDCGTLGGGTNRRVPKVLLSMAVLLFIDPNGTAAVLQRFSFPVNVPACTDATVYGYIKCSEHNGLKQWRMITAWFHTITRPWSGHGEEMTQFGPRNHHVSCDPPSFYLSSPTGFQLNMSNLLTSGYSASGYEASYPAHGILAVEIWTLRVQGSRYYWYVHSKCDTKRFSDPRFIVTIAQPPWGDWDVYVKHLRIQSQHHRIIGFATTVVALHPSQLIFLRQHPEFVALIQAGIVKPLLWDGAPKMEGVSWESQGFHTSYVFLSFWPNPYYILSIDLDEFLYISAQHTIHTLWAQQWKQAHVVRIPRVETLCFNHNLSEGYIWKSAAWPLSYCNYFRRMHMVKTISKASCWFPASVHERHRKLQSWVGRIDPVCNVLQADATRAVLLHAINSKGVRMASDERINFTLPGGHLNATETV